MSQTANTGVHDAALAIGESGIGPLRYTYVREPQHGPPRLSGPPKPCPYTLTTSWASNQSDSVIERYTPCQLPELLCPEIPEEVFTVRLWPLVKQMLSCRPCGLRPQTQ